jgi:DNA repair protein RadC
MDKGCSCIGVSHIASGGVSACHVDPKIVFATAVKAMASGIILAHNHPSGNMTPSPTDLMLTEQFEQCGRVMTVKVHDHLIVTPNSFCAIKSFDADLMML